MCLADSHSSGDEALTCAAFLVIQALGGLQGRLESLGKGLRAGRDIGRAGTLGQLEDRDDQAARAEGTHVARALTDVSLAARGQAHVGEGSRYVGSFRACGLIVPVFELPEGASAADVAPGTQALAKALEAALKATERLDDKERRARQGLVSRAVTIR